MARGFLVLMCLCFFGIFLAVPGGLQGQQLVTEVMTGALRSMPLFEGLSDHEIEEIEKVSTLKEYPAGTKLIGKGERLDRLYLILTGRGAVRLKDRTIPFGRNFLLGEMEFVDPVPAVADVFLVSECRLVEIEYKPLDRLLRSRPQMGLAVMKNLARILSRKIQGMSQ